MTAGNRVQDYLEQMIQAAKNALIVTEGMNRESFLDDIATQSSVSMWLINIGEAANRIVDDIPDFCHENQDVPWKDIRGMRNRIAHDYFNLNFNTVWQVVENDLVPLVKSLEDISGDRLHQTAENENSPDTCPR